MTATQIGPDPASWIEAEVTGYCASSANMLQDSTHEPAWSEPLVGFSRGDDPLYEAYKEHVGEFHWTPLELFSQTFPETHVRAEEFVR